MVAPDGTVNPAIGGRGGAEGEQQPPRPPRLCRAGAGGAHEPGFLKRGEKSVGVPRQYTGTAGDTVDCQVGVFVAYASNKGAAFIDRTLYLPEEWANDPKRRAEAGVPEEVAFANKVELAKRMLQRAFEAGVPARWVLADSFYGRSHEFRAWLEKRGRAYAVTYPAKYKRFRVALPRSD